MVTPLAQFVGSQAAINVITGERYKEVTDQSIQYALGHWGKEAPAVMDANVKDKILSVRAPRIGGNGRRRISLCNECGKILARRVCRMKNWFCA